MQYLLVGLSPPLTAFDPPRRRVTKPDDLRWEGFKSEKAFDPRCGRSYLILLALPAWPKEIMRSMQTCFIAVLAGLR